MRTCSLLSLLALAGADEDTGQVYYCDKPGLASFTPGMHEGKSAAYLSFVTETSSPNMPARALEFTNCTGGRIVFHEADNVFVDPIADVGSRSAVGHELYDAYFMSFAHFPEASEPGLAETLNDRIAASNEELKYNDFFPQVKKMGEYRRNGKNDIDFLMYDGDFLLPIIRADLMEKHNLSLPNTWGEALELARLFDGLDLNDDGEADSAFCHFPRLGAGSWDWWWPEQLYSTWAAYAQTPSAEGYMFDEVTFEPQMDTPAFRRSVQIWRELWELGSGDCGEAFSEGKCAIGFGPPGCWKAVFLNGVKRTDANGTVVWAPTFEDGSYAEPYRLYPFGTTEVLDPAGSNTLMPCTYDLCSDAVPEKGHMGATDRVNPYVQPSPLAGQPINRAPFYWTGGLGVMMRKSAPEDKKDLMWDFMVYTNQPASSVEDVASFASWLDSWRYSQLTAEGTAFVVDSTWSEQAYAEHRAVMHWALSAEANGAVTLRVPGMKRYTYDALEANFQKLLEGEIDEDELVASTVAEWNAISDDLGKLDQLNIYRASMLFADELNDQLKCEHFRAAMELKMGLEFCQKYDEVASCEIGHVLKPSESGAVCEACEPGTYSLDNTCLPCPAGRTCERAVGCTAADPAATCPALCPLGHACGQGTSNPVPCESTHYQDEPGQVECKPCPTAYGISEGSTSVDGCICADDLRRDEAPAAAVCVACEEGLDCAWTGGGSYVLPGAGLSRVEQINNRSLAQTVPYLLPGYWADADEPLRVLLCDPKRVHPNCLGGDVLAAAGTCGDGRSGVMCAKCPDGFQARTSGGCEECDAGQDTGRLLGICLALLLLLVGIHEVGIRTVTLKQLDSLASVAVLGMLLEFVQALAAIHQLKVRWASPLSDVLDALDFLTLRLEVLQPACIDLTSPALRLTAKVLAPLVLLLLLVLVHCARGMLCRAGRLAPHAGLPVARVGKGAAAAAGKGKGGKAAARIKPSARQLDTLLNTVGTVLLALYPSLSLAALSPFVCFEQPDGSEYSFEYEGAECSQDSATYRALFGIAVGAVLLYPVGLLLGAAYLVHRFSRVAHAGAELAGEARLAARLRFLFVRWRPERYYYTTFRMVRNLAIAAVPVIDYDAPEASVAVLSLLLACSLAQQVVLWPWRRELLNYLDAGLSVALLQLLAVAGAGGGASDRLSVFVTVLLGAALLAALAFLAMILLQQRCPGWRVSSRVERLERQLEWVRWNRIVDRTHHVVAHENPSLATSSEFGGEYVDGGDAPDDSSLHEPSSAAAEVSAKACPPVVKPQSSTPSSQSDNTRSVETSEHTDVLSRQTSESSACRINPRGAGSAPSTILRSAAISESSPIMPRPGAAETAETRRSHEEAWVAVQPDRASAW